MIEHSSVVWKLLKHVKMIEHSSVVWKLLKHVKVAEHNSVVCFYNCMFKLSNVFKANRM